MQADNVDRALLIVQEAMTPSASKVGVKHGKPVQKLLHVNRSKFISSKLPYVGKSNFIALVC